MNLEPYWAVIAQSAPAFALFGVLFLATIALHAIGYFQRPRSSWSRVQLLLGGVVVACMVVQFYVAQQQSVVARATLAQRLPRTITNAQEKLIVGLLNDPAVEKGRVLIDAALEGEAWAFGDKVREVLLEAGFQVGDVPTAYRALAFNRPGQFLWIKDAKNPPKQAHPIYEAFRHAGINLTREAHEAASDVPDAETVVIAISSHP